mmetsp:Transcript_47675/g.89228  ORF Transcript_47675/g.89228 Transcript_47675/m.89228 type:complete len:238 (+) Transcript_47675:467-1180(+)
MAPASSLMYLRRISLFWPGPGSLVLSQSSIRPLLSSMSAIQCTFWPVKTTTTSPVSRCRFPLDVKPSIRPRRKRKMSEPRCPSNGRQPPITMSASSMKTTDGAAACAAAKTLMMSAWSIISRTRKNLPLRRFASQRPTVVLPVPGCPCRRTPRFGVRPNCLARSGFSRGNRTLRSNSSLMPSRPGKSARSTGSTSSGATADTETSSSLIEFTSASVETLLRATRTRAVAAFRSAGES